MAVEETTKHERAARLVGLMGNFLIGREIRDGEWQVGDQLAVFAREGGRAFQPAQQSRIWSANFHGFTSAKPEGRTRPALQQSSWITHSHVGSGENNVASRQPGRHGPNVPAQ